jgi:uncharacterized membrane protein
MQARVNFVVSAIFATGALLTSACGGSSCKTPDKPPSYAGDGIDTIVKDHCLQCHTSRGTPKLAPPAGTFYNDYSGMLAQAKTAEERVTLGDMPPTTEPAMSANEKERFSQWVLCGSKP